MSDQTASDAPATTKRRKKKNLPAWTHGAVYAGVRTGAAAINIAGVGAATRGLASFGGVFASLPFNKHRLARAKENLAWCFPEWDEARIHRYSIEAYRHLFSLGAEVALAPRLLTEDGYATHIELGDLRAALAPLLMGEPTLLLTGHCGNWEMLGYTVALLGFPVHALYRPIDMKPVDRWVRETRSRRGMVLVDKFGAARVLPGLMERGVPLGFIADQNGGDKGLFVPFFDRLASSYKTIGLLALQFNARVLCAQARRLGGLPGDGVPASFRYAIEVVDTFGPDDWADQPDPLFYITARYRRALEDMVRRAPEQYLWMHRYWKSRPAHERKGRPFPDKLREKIEALPWMTPQRVQRVIQRSAVDADLYAQRAARR